MVVIYDLETLRDFFLYVDLDLKTDEFHIFEISRFKNDYKDLCSYLEKLEGQIGFNNVAFDSQVQEFLITNSKHFNCLDGLNAANIISEKANETIARSNKGEWPQYWERELSIRQVDLFKVWHYNNKQKTTSLKWLQYMFDWHNIEDMPIGHNDSVDTREKADLIISYCKNDCLSTRKFYEITRGNTEISLYKGIDKLQLRKDVNKEFNFICTNFDDVKIGDELNKINYLKATGISRKELKEKKSIITSFTFEDCFPSYMKFVTPKLNKFIDGIRNIPVLLDSKQEFNIKIGSTTHTMAKGGIHSQDSPRLIIPTKDQRLRDADVGSQYPNSIRKRRIFPRHLGEKWLDGYTDIIEKRIKAKKLYKETKDPKYQSIQEAFKLALNGGSFGKMGTENNWQTDPFQSFKVTIGNQIEILMLIEKMDLAGINVVSSNTDGIVSLFDRNQEDLYNKICKEWEITVGNETLGQLEFADYSLLAERSVNDYLAVKTDGSVKYKGGSFTINHELHRNKSNKVIALALNEFYVKGINPRLFITNHKNIFDFCAGMRTKGDWYLDAITLKDNQMIREKLQKTNRYFISNKGVKLVKCHPDGRQIQEDSGDWKATVYNKHIEKPIEQYDINYDFYVKKAYEIIGEIQPEIINEQYKQLSIF